MCCGMSAMCRQAPRSKRGRLEVLSWYRYICAALIPPTIGSDVFSAALPLASENRVNCYEEKVFIINKMSRGAPPPVTALPRPNPCLKVASQFVGVCVPERRILRHFRQIAASSSLTRKRHCYCHDQILHIPTFSCHQSTKPNCNRDVAEHPYSASPSTAVGHSRQLPGWLIGQRGSQRIRSEVICLNVRR